MAWEIRLSHVCETELAQRHSTCPPAETPDYEDRETHCVRGPCDRTRSFARDEEEIHIQDVDLLYVRHNRQCQVHYRASICWTKIHRPGLD